MYLIVGLGNPGISYSKNRHNVGFIIVDQLIDFYNLQSEKSKFDSDVAKGTIAGHKVLAIKPQLYMNNSGKAVSQFVNFYKINPENVIVIYDEIALDFLKIKINQGGGAAGHNGIRSINQHIKNEYYKFRFGVGHPGDKDKVSGYVLGDFDNSELEEIDKIGKDISEVFDIFVAEDKDKFLNALALRRNNGI